MAVEEALSPARMAEQALLQQSLAELEAIYQELHRRRREQGLAYFTPNLPQLKLLQSKARIIVFCAGNRVGKSSGGAVWLAAHLTGTYKSCPCHGEWVPPTRHFLRPLKAVIVVTEFQKIESVIEPKLLAYLPKGWITSIKRSPQGYLRRVTGRNGAFIDVLSGEQDPMAFEGQDWDLAWIDEPMERGRFTAIQRGLMDREGLMLLTFTPLIEPWMKADLVDQQDGVNIEVIQADSYANLADIHGKAIQSRAAIDFLRSMMSEDEQQSRIYGRFFHLKGIVYKEFDPLVHVRDFTYAYPDPVIGVLDPHPRQPHHILWAFVDRHDNIFIDRELVVACPLPELKRLIMRTEQEAGYRMKRRLIDPNMGPTPSISTGRTVMEELAAPPFSVVFDPADDHVEAGILKVRELLAYNPKLPLSYTNQPRLYFHFQRVPRTVHSIRNLQYAEWKGKTAQDRNPKEEVKGKDDHGATDLRYLALSHPRFDHLTRRTSVAELSQAPY